jgi:amino acid transporter
MVGTIILNMICGLIFLVPLMFVLPDIAEVVATGQPLPAILSSAIGHEGGAFALTVPIIVLGILCGTGCTTAASRCTWAFSRDGAIPGSRWWKQVNRRLDVPLNAMMLSMVIQIALGCIYFGSTAAFNAFNGVGVIFLTVAYVSPVIVSLLGGRKNLSQGAYDFGLFGVFCNIVTIGEFSRFCSIPFRNFSS